MTIKTLEHTSKDVTVDDDRLLRCPEVEALRGFKRGRIYQECREGLLPAPIKNGKRSLAWVLSEIRAVNRARIAGHTDDQIRALVSSLLEQRTAGGDK